MNRAKKDVKIWKNLFNPMMSHEWSCKISFGFYFQSKKKVRIAILFMAFAMRKFGSLCLE